MSCSCHPESPEDHLEQKFAAAADILAKGGKPLSIEQELLLRDVLGLKAPHELPQA